MIRPLAILAAIGCCACGGARTSPSATSARPEAEAPAYPALVDLARCKLLEVPLEGRDELDIEPGVFAWDLRCGENELHIVEMVRSKPLHELFDRVEDQAHISATPTGPTTHRKLDEYGLKARTTPVRSALSSLLGKGNTPSGHIVSASWLLGFQAQRATSCYAENPSQLEWCYQAMRTIFKGKLSAIHRHWTSYGAIDVGVPAGCSVPKPGAIACRDSGLVWTTDPYEVERMLGDRSLDAAIESHGGTVASTTVKCTVGGQPGQCEVRDYTMPGAQGQRMKRQVIFAKSTLEGSNVAVGCDAGPRDVVPPVCQPLLRLGR